ncbi:unnamed protein product [Parnassius apollo]|uniref:(apollo) hypothetical protein n=1 Tax=Parnassius apollo TaxID=110799 RepID=A0A8S3WY04_PARAO|nr:unnamed protein product [Parnassius apollo]
MRRIIRSPGYCGECEAKAGPPLPPLPPPPPGIPPFPVFHTKQWSGLTRSHDGLNQGLFSGAAAGIGGGVQSGSQAFSLASTAVGADTGAESVTQEQSSYNKDGKISDSFGQSSGGAGVFNGQNGGFGGLEKFSGGKGSFKESHFSYQSEGGKQVAFQKGLGFQAQKFNSGSSYGAHGKGFEISGNEQQKQQLQLESQHGQAEGSGSGQGGLGFVHGTGSEWGGNFENSDSKYGSQNAHHGHFASGSGYRAEMSGNEQQLQMGSQVAASGSGQEGTGYEHGSSAESAEHFESDGSKHGSQNAHHGDFTSGSDYIAYGKGSEISKNEQQLQMGSQYAGFGSGQKGTGYGHGSGFESADQFESGGSKHESQNAHHSDFTSGLGYSTHGNSGFSGNEQQQYQKQQQQLQIGSQNSYVSGSESGHEGFLSGAGSLNSHNGASASSGYGSKQQEKLQTGLSGALKLASEGLQQTQQQQGGCSTCDKSSYALSNAKSHSGSAIALSVAG